jgi:hypothetical protein
LVKKLEDTVVQAELIEAPRRNDPLKDFYFKLGRKRELVWNFLFGDNPLVESDDGYLARKAKVIDHLRNYHECGPGVQERFVGDLEKMFFGGRARNLEFLKYRQLQENPESFDEDVSDEDSATSKFDFDGPRRVMPHDRSLSSQGASSAKGEGLTPLTPRTMESARSSTSVVHYPDTIELEDVGKDRAWFLRKYKQHGMRCTTS